MDQETSLYTRYVYLSRKKGMDNEKVRKSLIDEGWTKSQVEDLISIKPKKDELKVVKVPLKATNSLLNLRLQNGKLYLKVLAVILISAGTVIFWQTRTGTATYQDVFTNYVSALEKNDQKQAVSYESQKERQQLSSSHSSYNSCNSDTTTCNQALAPSSLKAAHEKTISYVTSTGSRGEEQIYSESLSGCAGGMISVDITALPVGDSFKINNIDIVKSPAASTCATPSSALDTQPPTPQPSTGANRATPVVSETPKAPVVKTNSPNESATTKLNTTLNDSKGLLPSVSLTIGNQSTGTTSLSL